ncbi:hypothetical protein ACF1AB_39755 [Streptomyces sp. NPDC014846]|uniref:hypothetical protein n=1 Tax=Streptomyces sp. NPDC014846 TaxID=3364922 RepID=UPI0036FCDB9E
MADFEPIEMYQTGPDTGAAVVATPDGLVTMEFGLSKGIDVSTDPAEWDAIYDLNNWVRTAAPDRFWDLELTFLQFDECQGREFFTADEIRTFRAFLAEQRDTDRWNCALASYLAKLEAAEVQLAE